MRPRSQPRHLYRTHGFTQESGLPLLQLQVPRRLVVQRRAHMILGAAQVAILLAHLFISRLVTELLRHVQIIHDDLLVDDVVETELLE